MKQCLDITVLVIDKYVQEDLHHNIATQDDERHEYREVVEIQNRDISRCEMVLVHGEAGMANGAVVLVHGRSMVADVTALLVHGRSMVVSGMAGIHPCGFGADWDTSVLSGRRGMNRKAHHQFEQQRE